MTMRLIDADKIPWTDLNDNPNSNIKVLVTFAEKVNRMPTIEERKTGKWIETDSHEPCWYKCDQCGRLSDIKEIYCPTCGASMVNTTCGADMRGEEQK